MTDEKDIALTKAAQLVGYVMSSDGGFLPANDAERHKRACELAECVSRAISQCYQPLYLQDEAGKMTQVK